MPTILVFSYLWRGVCLYGCSSKAQPLLLTLDEGYLLTAAPLDLECGVAPFNLPSPTQPLLPGGGVAPQEITVVRGKFDLRVQYETGQRLIEICQENALVITYTVFQQHK